MNNRTSLVRHAATTLAARGCRLLLAALFFHTGADAATPFTRDLAPLRLRGYGEVSAKFTSGQSAQGEAVSTLAITCEDEAKAGIVLAKFVSDLHLLCEIEDDTLAVGGVKAPVFVVARQGVIAAFRNGKVVTILASPTGGGLNPEAVLELGRARRAPAESARRRQHSAHGQWRLVAESIPQPDAAAGVAVCVFSQSRRGRARPDVPERPASGRAGHARDSQLDGRGSDQRLEAR